jgi:hypothetical protein
MALGMTGIAALDTTGIAALDTAGIAALDMTGTEALAMTGIGVLAIATATQATRRPRDVVGGATRMVRCTGAAGGTEYFFPLIRFPSDQHRADKVTPSFARRNPDFA